MTNTTYLQFLKTEQPDQKLFKKSSSKVFNKFAFGTLICIYYLKCYCLIIQGSEFLSLLIKFRIYHFLLKLFETCTQGMNLIKICQLNNVVFNWNEIIVVNGACTGYKQMLHFLQCFQ